MTRHPPNPGLHTDDARRCARYTYHATLSTLTLPPPNPYHHHHTRVIHPAYTPARPPACPSTRLAIANTPLQQPLRLRLRRHRAMLRTSARPPACTLRRRSVRCSAAAAGAWSWLARRALIAYGRLI
jgi:hypothetical protein